MNIFKKLFFKRQEKSIKQTQKNIVSDDIMETMVPPVLNSLDLAADRNVLRQTKQPDCGTINPANAKELCLRISEGCIGKELYCCVFHHPLRSACVTPYSYPVDYVHIVSNEQFTTDTKTYTDDISQITLRLVKSKACKRRIVLDKKICYKLPICDAMESWEFVFSHTPIVPDRYLDGYEHLSGNCFGCESDLIESKRRMENLWRPMLFTNEQSSENNT